MNTSDNPVDYASRGLTVNAFLKEKTWIMGPDFLTTPESEWPEMPHSICQPLKRDPEVKEASVYALSAQQSTNTTSQLIHHYSSWCRLKRSVLRLKSTLKRLAKKRKDLTTSFKAGKLDEQIQRLELDKQMKSLKASLPFVPLSVSDVAKAELDVVRFSQREKICKDIAMLQDRKAVPKSSPLYRLSPGHTTSRWQAE